MRLFIKSHETLMKLLASGALVLGLGMAAWEMCRAEKPQGPVCEIQGGGALP